jgi:Zn-dependent protease/CBS domain-containing protein
VSTPQRPAGQDREVNPRLLRLGSVLGVPIFVTPSWLLVAGFITLSYADFLHAQIDGVSRGVSYGLALLFAIALALSVLAHELGHTVVSRVVGMQVRRIVVFLLGGVSEIEGETRRPRDEFVIAAAGPAVSFMLAAGFWGLGSLPPSRSAAGVLLILLAWSNLVIAVFNVLPGLPLDGGRLLQAVVWQLGNSRNDSVRIAAWSGRVVAVVIALAVLVGNSLASRGRPVDFTSIGATAMGFAVAAFLWFGASQTLRVTQLGERAAALEIGHLIRPTIYVPPQTPISEAVRRVAEAGAAGIVVIDAAGRSRGIVREADIARLDPARRPWMTVADVSRSLEPGLVISDNLSGEDLLQLVRSTPASEYLVIGSDGISRGVMATVDLARALGVPQPRPAY